MHLLCRLGEHAYYVTPARVALLVRVDAAEDWDGTVDGETVRWQPLEYCARCGTLRTLGGFRDEPPTDLTDFNVRLNTPEVTR